MNNKQKVLLLSNSEICYNPRLAKAADSLYEQGYEVDVYNPILGIVNFSVYSDFLETKKWNIIEFDISKRNFKSKINWLIVGIANKIFLSFYNLFNLKIGFQYIKNRGLMGFKKRKDYDIIIIHLVDSLPFAAKLKKKNKNSVLIYDSQEYFTGQYSIANQTNKKWVNYAEQKYIYDADIILATTNIMSDKIAEKYNLKTKPIRVRNFPYNKTTNFSKNDNNPIKLVWHGLRIIFENRRGLHILLKAVAETNANIEFYIQGLISNEEREKINSFAKKNNIEDKIKIIPSAPPDKIVESLTGYDIGLIGELPEEENQMYTSSNKLFEYISAGLAVIMPDVPGLRETADEFNSFELYTPGNSKELSEKIIKLISDKELLKKIKAKSQEISGNTVFWDSDYKTVLKTITEKKSN